MSRKVLEASGAELSLLEWLRTWVVLWLHKLLNSQGENNKQSNMWGSLIWFDEPCLHGHLVNFGSFGIYVTLIFIHMFQVLLHRTEPSRLCTHDNSNFFIAWTLPTILDFFFPCPNPFIPCHWILNIFFSSISSLTFNFSDNIIFFIALMSTLLLNSCCFNIWLFCWFWLVQFVDSELFLQL